MTAETFDLVSQDYDRLPAVTPEQIAAARLAPHWSSDAPPPEPVCGLDGHECAWCAAYREGLERRGAGR